MDPLSVAGSIVGLISAGAQLVPMFYNLALAIKDAPDQARVAVSEVEAITMLLMQLQRYIDGSAQAPVQRLSLIHLEQVQVALTECVMTFSDLDALLKALHIDTSLKRWDRAVWLVKKQEVGGLIGRLQSHKATLGLMLQIIQCTTMAEAERTMDRLCHAVNEVLLSNQALSTRLRNMEHTMSSRKSARTVRTVDTNRRSVMSFDRQSLAALDNTATDPLDPPLPDPNDLSKDGPGNLANPQLVRLAFEDQLHLTRVYRHAANRHSWSSMYDDGRSTLAISLSSSLTLGEVSNVSVYALPIFAEELSNAECYEQPATPAPPVRHFVEVILERVNLERSRSDRLTLRLEARENSLGHRATSAVFGKSVETSIGYAGAYICTGVGLQLIRVPVIVAKCVAFLKEKHPISAPLTQVWGGSRDALGYAKRMLYLEKEFNRAPKYGAAVAWGDTTASDCLGLLLRYLHRLPDPVIPCSLHDAFHELVYASIYIDIARAKENYGRLRLKLSESRRHLLICLLDLIDFMANEPYYAISLETLVKVFWPAILDPLKDPVAREEHELNCEVLKYLIQLNHPGS